MLTPTTNWGFLMPTGGQMLSLRPPSNIDKLTANVDKLADIVKTISIEHKGLMQDQDLLSKKIDKNTDEIRNLQTMHTEVKTVSNLARYGGLALISAIIAGWNSLSTKVDVVTAKTENNSQNIAYLQKDNLDDQKQIDALAAKVSENRENIITQLKAKEDKK